MLIDIFTDTYQPAGVTTKEEAHRSGLWHRVFTCLVVNPVQGSAFLQLRTPGLLPFLRPDYLDISVGGHYASGELIEDGVREISEELGLRVAFPDLISLGIRQTAATITSNYIANEFQHIFLLARPLTLDDFALSGAEVRGLVEVNLEEAISLLLEDQASIPARSRSWSDGYPGPIENIYLDRTNFPPAYLTLDKFFLRLFIAATRILGGEEHRRVFW